MEKDYRLFVKNLPLNITEDKIKELFSKYATIKCIDLKEKKDLDDKLHKFAFINITTSDKSLHTCVCDLNGERIDGFQINVELAKESFLERLKRERSEKEAKPQATHVPTKEDSKPDVFNNIVSTAKRQTFSDADFTSNDFKIEVPKTKKKFSYDLQEEGENNEQVQVQTSSDQENFQPQVTKVSNEFIKPKKQIFFDEDGIESEKIKDEITLKNKNVKAYNKPVVSQAIVKPAPISESEKKRLLSLKERKRAFKTQEQAIRDALKCVDKNQSNKKIIFNDDIDLQITTTKIEQKTSKNNTLFDSDDEDEEQIMWNDAELEAKAQMKKKLLKLQTNIGNDKRFVLDERFVDDEDKKETNIQSNNDDVDGVEDERKWQLDILGNILGKSIRPPTADSNDMIKKKNKMIRYDPTASNHQDYEVEVSKLKEGKPAKKKKKLSTTEVQEEPVIPTSKEVFYDVSDNLVQSLKQSEGFSLLKTFGRNASEADDGKSNANIEPEKNEGNFQFNFSAKNPFKYDSSDDEDGGEETNKKSNSTDINTNSAKFSRPKDDRLFFTHNDPRFEEAQQFFKNQVAQEDGQFKNRRRELKEIVRSKIRNNLKKSVPWNRRKVRKIQKKK